MTTDILKSFGWTVSKIREVSKQTTILGMLPKGGIPGTPNPTARYLVNSSPDNLVHVDLPSLIVK